MGLLGFFLWFSGSDHAMPLGRKWRLARGIAFSLEHAFGLKKYTAKVWNALYLTTLSREINPLRWSDPIEVIPAPAWAKRDQVDPERLRLVAHRDCVPKVMPPDCQAPSRTSLISISRSTNRHSSVARSSATKSSNACSYAGAYSNQVRKSKGSASEMSRQ